MTYLERTWYQYIVTKLLERSVPHPCIVEQGHSSTDLVLARIDLGEAPFPYLLVYDELAYGIATNRLRPAG